MRKVIPVFSAWQKGSDILYRNALEHVDLESKFIKPRPFDGELEGIIREAPGVLFSGGQDMHPRYADPGNPVHPTVKSIDEVRDDMEVQALKLCLDLEKPIFAVCRGLQLFNCVLGGDLYQDLDSQAPPAGVPKFHRQTDREIRRDRPSHEMIIEEGTLLYRIIGRKMIRVNSTHHQGIRNLAPGLVVSGRAPDGVIEAVEIPGRENVIVVQFHPERLWRRLKSIEKLFKYFAEVINK